MVTFLIVLITLTLQHLSISEKDTYEKSDTANQYDLKAKKPQSAQDPLVLKGRTPLSSMSTVNTTGKGKGNILKNSR